MNKVLLGGKMRSLSLSLPRIMCVGRLSLDLLPPIQSAYHHGAAKWGSGAPPTHQRIGMGGSGRDAVAAVVRVGESGGGARWGGRRVSEHSLLSK